MNAIISCRWRWIAASSDKLTECVCFTVPIAHAVTMDPISKAARFAKQTLARCVEQAAIDDVGVDRVRSSIQVDLDEGMVDKRSSRIQQAVQNPRRNVNEVLAGRNPSAAQHRAKQR